MFDREAQLKPRRYLVKQIGQDPIGSARIQNKRQYVHVFEICSLATYRDTDDYPNERDTLSFEFKSQVKFYS